MAYFSLKSFIRVPNLEAALEYLRLNLLETSARIEPHPVPAPTDAMRFVEKHQKLEPNSDVKIETSCTDDQEKKAYIFTGKILLRDQPESLIASVFYPMPFKPGNLVKFPR